MLTALSPDYQVVLAGGRRCATYETIYFDAAGRQFYHDHRRGRRPRYKVRIRHHIERRLTFLEVKRKDNSERTVKTRLELPFSHDTFATREQEFVRAHVPMDPVHLAPAVWIAFQRVTLLNGRINERVTIDCNLRVGAAGRSEQLEILPGVAIVEVKQVWHYNGPGAITALRTQGVEQSLSKYCVATIHLASVRANNFKPALRAIDRLLNMNPAPGGPQCL
jgi:hypothetical protein